MDSNFLYWTNNGDSTIGRANLDGTGVKQAWMTGTGSPYYIAVDTLGPSGTTAAIPTLNEWGMILLSLSLGLAAVARLRQTVV